MGRILKLSLFVVARSIGLFAIARLVTRHRLRIIAYHGFASGDELKFRPKLFISPSTFERRLALLARRGFSVLTLDEAVQHLNTGNIPKNSVVITIDDGYASTLHVAAPLLSRFRFPATVYITTYHVEKQTPVFDLVIAYLIWRSGRPSVSLDWPPGGRGLHLDASRAEVELVRIGRSLEDEPTRVALCRALGEAVEVSYDEVLRHDAFRLMTEHDIAKLRNFGIQVALHTHRHRFPPGDVECCRQELLQNKERLLAIEPMTTNHFCYPSGVYSPSQWQLLQECGVASATTCENGLMRAGHSLYSLNRFLDGEMVSEVEFDGEICGFADLLRALLGRTRFAG